MRLPGGLISVWRYDARQAQSVPTAVVNERQPHCLAGNHRHVQYALRRMLPPTPDRTQAVEHVKQEILFLKRWRNPDNVSIAGGEPLIHPEIVEIVGFIAEQGVKPIILTNAKALTPEFLREMKGAGLAGFTIHIDSHQSRPGWQGKSEAALNELRQHYADMAAAEGGVYVIFNSTVYPSTAHEIPDVVRWGQANIDRVHGLVFITYRTGITETSVGYDHVGHEVDLSQLSYTRERFEERFVTSPEVCQIIKDHCPEYQISVLSPQ